MRDRQADLDKITDFLSRIGMPFAFRTLEPGTFLPGILISEGKLLIDPAACLYVGDILHEAGHFAVLTPQQRATVHGNVGDEGEMAAMLWSYAVALEIGLDPKTVFHSEGYKGDADWLLERYAEGSYIGLPMLQWYGLALDPVRPLGEGPVFPAMLRWLRDDALAA